MRRTTPQTIKALAASAAAALALGGVGVPTASAQQILLPGSSSGIVIGAGDAPAPALDPASDEYRTQLIDATNAARIAHGVGPLEADPVLNQVATAWSQTQADSGRMFHNPDLRGQIPGGASRWSENVLQNWRSASPQDLVNQWMASPAHRVNLLRADHTTMGMGVAVAPDNKLYATQVFARY